MWWRDRFRLGCLGAALAAVVPLSAQAQSTCGDLSERCGGLIAPSCLDKVGAGSLAVDAEASCVAQFEAYRGCLAEAAGACGDPARPSPPSRATSSEERAPPPGHKRVAETPVPGGRFLFLSTPEPITWAEAEQAAVSMGGRLAVLDTPAKQNAMASVLSRRPELFHEQVIIIVKWMWGPWIGGYQRAGADEPRGGWVWSLDPVNGTSAPIDGGNWFDQQPNNWLGGENYLNISCAFRPTCDTWNDAPADAPIQSYIVEIPE